MNGRAPLQVTLSSWLSVNTHDAQRLYTSVCRLCISDAASEADLVRASRLPTKLPCLSSFSSGVICVQHNQDFACKFVMKSELFTVFMHKPERCATLSAAMHSCTQILFRCMASPNMEKTVNLQSKAEYSIASCTCILHCCSTSQLELRAK